MDYKKGDRDSELYRAALFLGYCELPRAYRPRVDAIGKLEPRVEADLWMLRRDVLLDKIFEGHARYADTIKADGIDMHFALATTAAGVSLGLHFVRAAKQREQRIARAASGSDFIKVDGGGG